MIAGGTLLPCRCASPHCPHTGTDARAEHIVIHVLTNHTPTTEPQPEPQPEPREPPACPTRTAVIAGGGLVPAPLLAELARIGAAVTPITDPATLGREAGYRPSTALARFIRARDLTCAQGCDRPAQCCDLDHTTPWGRGLTHPGNLKCLCRKTFASF